MISPALKTARAWPEDPETTSNNWSDYGCSIIIRGDCGVYEMGTYALRILSR